MNENPGEMTPPEAPNVPEPTTPTDPMARPMEKAQPAETQPKKKKTGLIIGIIAAVLVLIGGGIALAIVLAGSNKIDAVSAAMSKIIEGNTSSNLVVGGTIDLALNDKDIPFEKIKIELNSEGIMSSLINSSSIVMTVTLRGGDDIKITFDEVYASNGDLYFKIDGIKAAIEDLTTVNKILNPEASEGDDSMSIIAGVLAAIKTVDGKWLKVSTDELGALTQGNTESSDLSCLVDFARNANSSTNTLAEIYRRNPFVYSNNKNLPVASKDNPIYEVMLDEEMFKGFVAATEDSVMAEQLYNCLGHSNAQMNVDSITADLNDLPTIYVEVDDDYNFTRLYFTSNIQDGNIDITTDLDFKYPTNVNVPEPLEYKNFSDVISEIFKTMYDTTD